MFFLQLKPFFFSFDNKSFICYRFISWFDCNRGIFTIVTLVFVITSIMECSVIYRTKFPLLKDKETEPIVGWDFSLYFVSFNQFSLVIWRMGDHFVLLVDGFSLNLLLKLPLRARDSCSKPCPQQAKIIWVLPAGSISILVYLHSCCGSLKVS